MHSVAVGALDDGVIEGWFAFGELDHVVLRIRLDDTMLDLDEPVVVVNADHELFRGVPPRTILTLARTLEERGDPRGLFSAEIEVSLPDS